MRLFKFLGFFILCWGQLTGQNWENGQYHSQWSDSVLNRLSLKQQIAQMMMVAAWSNQGSEHIESVDQLIRDYQIGGLIFFQGSAIKQAYLTNYYQQNSRIPLFIGIDGEWGLSMRLKEMPKFPFQMTLGAAADKDLIYQEGLAIGKQCKRLGVHINFAPDIDVNTNPDNPIIGFRSFGENPYDVGVYGILMAHGMQDAGIIACAKHFPGHGDSRADSHLELPFIGHDRERLESVELHPFDEIFSAGVMSTMVGHLEIPSLDSNRHRPSSLSQPIVTGLLKGKMGFNGLVITDALNMKGVTKYYSQGYAEAAAVLAGNDILLFPEDVPKAIEVILEEVNAGHIDSAEIAERVRKILFFKQLAGLDHYSAIDTRNLYADLDKGEATILSERTAREAVTVVSDRNNILPLPFHTVYKTAVWNIGKTGNYLFSKMVADYQNSDVIFSNRDSGYEYFNKIADSLIQNYDQVIISLHDWNLWGKKSQIIPQQIIQNIYKIVENRQTVIVLFGNIYMLRNLPNLPCALVAFEDSEPFQKTAAEIIFGKIPALGHLPAMAGPGYFVKQGIDPYPRSHFFEEIKPEEAGFKQNFTAEMDALLNETRSSGAAPGGQVLVLKDGKSVYNRAWGYFEYDEKRPVTKTDMYDLASVTKVAATTLALMKLQELNLLRLDAQLYTVLPAFKGTNKEKITIRELLLHESGLPAWIPFYKDALQFDWVFSKNADSSHAVEISPKTWMNAAYRDIMWQKIMECPVDHHAGYVYSDLNMIILAKVVEQLAGMPLDEYVNKKFYEPMHLNRTLFNPMQRYPAEEMAPTTEDHYFRNEKIQGTVHDPAAAMFGGVAGNAGLFSNANELGVLMQMLLNQGVWDEHQYLKPGTIREYTKAGHRKTHRGLGFDKPNGHKGDRANISEMVPESMFGHTGFTGNWAFADPENHVVFIFLSNRTYPDEANKKLVQNNIRTRAIEIVYKSL